MSRMSVDIAAGKVTHYRQRAVPAFTVHCLPAYRFCLWQWVMAVGIAAGNLVRPKVGTLAPPFLY